jgi:hypothetical protein
MRWRLTDSHETHISAGIAVDSHGNVWDVVDNGKGAELYCLRFWPKDSNQHVWEIELCGSLCNSH